VEQIRPLPRGTVIADLGCGDAGLARALVPEGKVVLSYDLVGDAGVPGADDSKTSASGGGEGWVVQADFLSHVPLPGRPGGLAATDDSWKDKGKKLGKKDKRDRAASEVVDVVVCCLSLMGTNWIGGVYEAVRVLRLGGTLHIAEVTSRLVSPDAFAAAVASFGLVLEEQAQPSTHFTLFRFTKRALPQGPVRGERGWDARVREGEDVLRACVYKKR
jgi:ribosomal RNA-processing protein 8